MTKVNCLNPISELGTGLFNDNYEMTDNFADADVALVRSAAMHDLDLPESLLAIARAGAGVNNIPLDKCADKGVVVFNTRSKRISALWHASCIKRYYWR